MNPESFIGKTIGNFQIVKKIGEGSYSTVFLAKEVLPQSNESKDNNQKENIKAKSPRYIACKIIPQDKVKHKSIAKRLSQEIHNHHLMYHPNDVKLIDVLRDSKYYYIFL